MSESTNSVPDCKSKVRIGVLGGHRGGSMQITPN